MQPTLQDLIDLVRGAGAALRDGLGGDHAVAYKGDYDIVTEVDQRAEALVVAGIRRRFAGDAILTEEGGLLPGLDGRIWYLDPLDGTVNYARGLAQACVALAYAEGGVVRLGVVYDPFREEWFTAERGAGAWLNGAPLHCTQTRTLADSLVCTGFPHNDAPALEDALKIFPHFARGTRGLRRLGSAALDLCYVACGRLDLHWEVRLQPWDAAAAGLIAEEAGARVTRLTGGHDYLRQPVSILAGNPSLHAEALAVICHVLDGRD